ncbi:MAG: hypothetical protein Q4C20_13325 [Erysipelotrichaceae bacterium]|nr:hypothetical protein [Erysipelotrichaceae bacterium]
MKKILNALLAVVLMITLTGCSADQIAYKKYSGTWVMKEANVEESETATNAIAAALALVKLFGGEIDMVLKEDGTGSLSLRDDANNITWNAEAITMEDKQYTYKVSKDQLVMNLDEKNTITFEKKTE